MCGIAGIYAYDVRGPQVDAVELDAIRDRMAARGPDGQGHFMAPDRRIGLAHRRLSIIDLDARASQPMHHADGRFTISYNGEIYNYERLRDGLEAQGCRFRTSSDTEVILQLFERYGPGCVRRLRGMFAFALWDAHERCLWLARDPYGIKPLYLADDGRTLRFASQVRALIAGGGVSTSRDVAAEAGLYLTGSVPEPFTIHEAIKPLPAGSLQRFDADGAGRRERYHCVADTIVATQKDPGISLAERRLAVREAVRDSVLDHLVADVEVGAFLSAGIDSGALVGLASETVAAPRSVTLSFDEFRSTPSDEAPLARAVAHQYGSEHHVRLVTQREFVADLPAILRDMDQPSIDGINTWYVCKATAELGLKVAISGVGGDELLAGYDTFRRIPWLATATRAATRVPGVERAFDVAANAIGRFRPVGPKLSAIPRYGKTIGGSYLLTRGLFLAHELSSLMGAERAEQGLAQLDLLGQLDGLIDPHDSDPVAHVAALESTFYLRNQLLRDSDWASMAHSIELRTPLVDVVLLQRLASMGPPQPGVDKDLLAQAPARPLPDSLRRRRKTGFGTPVARWLDAAPQLDAWRSVPQLSAANCPYARRLAHGVLAAYDG